MLKDRLNLKMDYFCLSGRFLGVEEQLILQTSLPTLQQENKFSFVSFFGKVFGNNKDYYIAVGIGNDYIRNKQFFYSLDINSWRLLRGPNEEDLKNFHLMRNLFEGDPMYMHRFYDNHKKTEMKEESRLSAFVKLLDYETAIGPKNALMITPDGIIKKNPYFEGLSRTDALDLGSYLHFRLPDSDVNFAPTTILCPPGGDRALQFLEPIRKDYPDKPLGCWNLQCDGLQQVVTLRNLWWPGFRFYHIPGTGQYKSIYMGSGDRNVDFPFQS